MTGGQRRQFRFNMGRAVRDHRWLAVALGLANGILLVRALRFVLNRVGLAEAVHTSRRSFSDMDRQFRSQGTSDSMWPVRSLGFRDERAPQAGVDTVRLDSERIPDGGEEQGDLDQQARTASEPAAPQGSAAEDGGADRSERDAEMGVEATTDSTASSVKFAPPKLPDWFRGGSSGTDSSEPVQPAAQTQQAAQEIDIPPSVERADDVVLRLSALRGAVSALGLKNLGRRKELPTPLREQLRQIPAEQIEAATAVGTPVEAGGRSAAEVRVQTDAGAAIAAVPEKAITAEPEKLAPREFVPVKKIGPANDWGEDEVRILPARRGQYER